MSEPYHIELRIASDPRYLCVSRAVINSSLKSLDVAAELRTQVTLAVDEAISNVIRHGYSNEPGGPIWLTFDVLPGSGGDGEEGAREVGGVGGLRIVIEDEARQVEPEDIRGRNLAEVRPGGLGVHIIEQVMDEVRYHKRGEKGMRLVMVRHVPATGQDGQVEEAAEQRERRR